MEDERTAALIALDQLQTLATQKLMAIVVSGRIDYDRIGDYLPVGRQLLKDTELYEQSWPGSFKLHTLAGPLVQQLSMYADWMDSAGDRQRAGQLRLEADEIAGRYLTAEQGAGYLRTRAMEAAAAGRFQDALIGLEQAQHAFVTEGRPIEAAQTLLQLANIFEWLGDYRRALSTMDAAQALEAERLANGPPTTAAVDAAIKKQMLDILLSDSPEPREGEDALSLRRLHYELVQGRARVNRRLGRFDDARRLFEDARPFVEEFVPAGVDFHLASIAIDTGHLDEAELLLRRVAPQFENGLLRPRRGALRQLQSDLALRRGDVIGAVARAEEGLAEQDSYPDLELAWKLQWRRARALARNGQAQASLVAYREAANAADTVRLTPLGYVLDTTYLADKLPMFEEAIDTAVAIGDGVATAELIELVKARALAAVLSHPAEPGTDGADASRFDRLSHDIDALSFKIYAEGSNADARTRSELLRERREVLERIRIRDPRWRGLTVPPSVNIVAVCGRLGETDRAALVLYLRGHRVVAVLLKGGGALVGDKEYDQATMDALRAYGDNLTRVVPDPSLFDLSGESDVQLRDLLPDAIVDAMAEARTLLVVPHGILHLLPWATMQLNGQRLFVTRAVGVLPNLAAFLHSDDDMVAPTSIGLVGDPDYTGLTRYLPLPQAGAELTDLAGLYGPHGLVAPVARQGDATQQVLAGLLPQGGAGSLLHVVCHADVAPDEPLSSGLILTKSSLDAGEILRLGCGFPEVVLSACSTGWRPQSAHGLELAGDDALGLVASFLEAGARSLLVSITKAEDEVSRRFMVTWHSHRRSGADPLAALQRTQRKMDQEKVPVCLWAGFTAYSSV